MGAWSLHLVLGWAPLGDARRSQAVSYPDFPSGQRMSVVMFRPQKQSSLLSCACGHSLEASLCPFVSYPGHPSEPTLAL